MLHVYVLWTYCENLAHCYCDSSTTTTAAATAAAADDDVGDDDGYSFMMR